MFYELRVYTVDTGKMTALQQRFRDHTCGLFERHGFRPVGFWTNSIGGYNNEFCYLLEWDCMGAREDAWNGFLSDPDWIRVREESTANGPVVLRSENRIMKPTDFSPLGSNSAPFITKGNYMTDVPRVVEASGEISASAARIFELIADPALQPRWDGNDNLDHADEGQRVRAVGDIFIMTTKRGFARENHVVEFVEGARIAWKPAAAGEAPAGHLWRWTLDPIDPLRTRVTHTYDWTLLTDEMRVERARMTTADWLQASIDRLAALAEGEPGSSCS
jgi:uncharacterized protein YndB with AHSA1/START domain